MGPLWVCSGCGIRWENNSCLFEQWHNRLHGVQIKGPTKTLPSPPTLCLSTMPSARRSREETCPLPLPGPGPPTSPAAHTCSSSH